MAVGGSAARTNYLSNFRLNITAAQVGIVVGLEAIQARDSNPAGFVEFANLSFGYRD
jgi:hypothetical protein